MSAVRDGVANIYAETATFFEAIKDRFGPAYRKYELLYGPAVESPPLMLIGFQPGGSGAASEYDDPKVPDRCAYASEPWPLARRLREVFGEELLERSTGLNIVFARARTKTEYAAVEPEVRRAIADHSLDACRRLLSLIRPQRLVFIGLQTAGEHGVWNTTIRSDRGRSLLMAGEAFGTPAMSALHLSGCRISVIDRAAIAGGLRAFVGLPSLAQKAA